MKRLAILIMVPTLTLAGCGEFQSDQQFSAIQQLRDVDLGIPQQDVSKPACQLDYADYELSGKLMAFEITDKSNVSVGFNIFTSFLKAVGLKFKSETAKMKMSMDLKETLRPSEMVADVLGEGKSKETEFRVELDMLKLGLDVGYYYQTPVSKLSERTLNDSLKRLTTELAQVETTWTTKVVNQPNSKQIVIPAGSVAGVRLGDSFSIYNVELLWKGPACSSELLMERKTTSTPIAKARVVQLEKNAALLEIFEANDDAAIELGARVEVDQLPLAKKEKSRSLSRSVRIANISSGAIEVVNGARVDLSMYLNEQVTALLSGYNLYERK